MTTSNNSTAVQKLTTAQETILGMFKDSLHLYFGSIYSTKYSDDTHNQYKGAKQALWFACMELKIERKTLSRASFEIREQYRSKN